ncbi:MAG: TonB-dependent receptor [Ignavibacteriales bacterium]|nr:TonB-dependent receptor [Ignavibacteriales bacterium]
MKTIIATILILILVSAFASAQQKYTIKGKTFDEDGKPLPFVNVFLLNSLDGGMSDERGVFSFQTAKTGEVTLVASMIGYKKYSKTFKPEPEKTISLSIEMQNTAVNMAEIVVTASSYSSEKGKGVVMSSMDVITTPGGAADIFQSLKTLPGLTQVSESAQLYVRGGDPIETITMLDQASLYHPFTFESSYGGIFSNINTAAIKGMYFSSGGFSTKYGNALSGVLDIDTKDEPQIQRINLGVSLANASISSDIPIVENVLGVRLDARQSFTKPLFVVNGGIDRFTVTPTSRDVNGALVYKYSQTGRLKLFGLYGEDTQGVNVDRPEFNAIFDGASNNSLLNLQVRDVLFSDVLVKASASWNRYNSLWKLGVLDLTKRDNNYKLRADLEYQVAARTKLSFGSELEQRSSSYIGTVQKQDYDFRPNAPSITLDATLVGRRLAAYAEVEQASLFKIQNLFAVVGGRIDYIPEIDLRWIDPRLSIGYKLGEHSTLKFGWGIFHQHADPRLYSPEDGNPNLKALKATHYIAAYDYSFSDQADFRVEFYHKEYTDLPLKNAVLHYDNGGNGYARGIDLVVKGSIPGFINGWFSYGFVDTKRKWMDFEEFAPSSYDITHNVTMVLTYSVTPTWQIGVNYKFATGRPYTPAIGSVFHSNENIYEPIYAAKNSARYENYQRLDSRLTHFEQLFGGKFTVFYIEGLNILNIKNIFGYNYSADYSQRNEIQSYFGRRMIIFGMLVTL